MNNHAELKICLKISLGPLILQFWKRRPPESNHRLTRRLSILILVSEHMAWTATVELCWEPPHTGSMWLFLNAPHETRDGSKATPGVLWPGRTTSPRTPHSPPSRLLLPICKYHPAPHRHAVALGGYWLKVWGLNKKDTSQRRYVCPSLPLILKWGPKSGEARKGPCWKGANMKCSDL